MSVQHQPVDNKKQLFDLLIQHQSNIKAFGAARIGLFGSFVRDEQNDSSDVDLLVEFQAGKKTFKNMVHLNYYLQALIHRKIQLVTWMGLADFVKKEVVKEIEYVAIAD
ncbi:nucleotidyltransferase family protein [Salmonirosea aquatica]|uniref:Nucleotidyltransferase n=1 Tax=Salmonirosea aquatica TaxID=2654236 RepID=A0A7C9BII2_9BACT|nr:nucleotidyltransferase [Cytophagaceae bacterium SJW1-29]